MALTEKYVSDAGAGAHDGSSEANAFSWAEMITDINAGSKAGNRYNVKGAIAGGTAAQSLTAGGTTTSPVIIRGYASTIGDAYQGRTDQGPLITTNFATLTYTSSGRLTLGQHTILEGFIIAANVNTTAVTGASTGRAVVVRCKITNANTGSSTRCWFDNASGNAIVDCDCENDQSSGPAICLLASNSASRIFGCRVRNRAGVGISIQNQSVHCVGNVCYKCGTDGIELSGATSGECILAGNTVVGCTSDGIYIATGTTIVPILACNLITDNGGYGINGASATYAVVALFNRLDRNTSGAATGLTDWLSATSYSHETTSALQADEYEDYTNNDFRLKSTSPAISAGRFGGDIGAIKRQEAGGGGAAILVSRPGLVL